MLNGLEKHIIKSKDSNANNVASDSFGNINLLRNFVKDTGLTFGLPKAIRSGNFVNFLDTVELNSIELRTTGYQKNLPREQIIQIFTMPFLMALTFTRTGALL